MSLSLSNRAIGRVGYLSTPNSNLCCLAYVHQTHSVAWNGFLEVEIPLALNYMFSAVFNKVSVHIQPPTLEQYYDRTDMIKPFFTCTVAGLRIKSCGDYGE